MNELQFAYWLQGFIELSEDLDRPSKAQWQAIKDHLQLVFNKVTPQVGKFPGVQVAPIPPVAPSIPAWPQPPSVDRITTPWIRPLTDTGAPFTMPIVTC